MRLTNLLLCMLIVIIGAAGAEILKKELQVQRAQRQLFARIDSLERLGTDTRDQQHAYFAALGHAVGLLRNEQDRVWPGIDARLGDLDQSAMALRNDTAAIASQLGVIHSPEDIDVTSLDTYDALDQKFDSFRDTSHRTRLPCQQDDGTAVIITLGQSNAANYGLVRNTSKYDVLNFNVYDGQCYRARDPLLGASGALGNFATPLGDLLIERGLYRRVIIAPIAMGGSTVEEWADEGVFNRRILVLIRRLSDAGLTPTAILWHQGEANSGVGDSHGRQYRKNLREVIATFRRYGIEAPFFVALATKCGSYPRPNSDNIRDGQVSVVNPLENVFLGPDTDTLGDEYRDKEHCHFNARGLLRHAGMWADVLQTWAASKTLTRREAAAR
jgi:Carbohydrate esterase, sialic acid-specific acetylesterase